MADMMSTASTSAATDNNNKEFPPSDNSNGNGISVVISEPIDCNSSPPSSSPEEGSPALKAKRPSLSLPILRVEQLKEEGCSSPGSSANNSEDSEFSDTDIVSRLGEFVPPSDDLALKIAQQMDFYFSDVNILKDSFLLKHVRRNKEGFVNLKLITSFKKMKTLTRDYRVVAYSLRKHSTTLVVNEDGNKAKRHDPLPDYDETKTSRTVVAVNLPEEQKLTMESISNLFKHCGDIVMLQILKPGKSVPSDIKKHLSKHAEVGNVVCAVIEFEKHENAVKAISMSVDTEQWGSGLKVIMLATAASKSKVGDDSESDSEFKQKRRNKKKTLRSAAIDKDKEGLSSGSEGDFLMPRPRSRNSSFGSDNSCGRGGYQRTSLSPTHAEKSWVSPNGNSISNQRRRSVPLPQSPLADAPKNSPKASPKPSPKTSPRASPEMRRRASPEMRRRANSGGMPATPEPGSSPWVQRRMQANREMSPLAKGTNGRKVETILRTPRGPESGKGFYGGKGRGKPLVLIEC